jgi:hypothetical protein
VLLSLVFFIENEPNLKNGFKGFKYPGLNLSFTGKLKSWIVPETGRMALKEVYETSRGR